MANLILEAVRTALKEGEATVNLNEASALTGSGSGVGAAFLRSAFCRRTSNVRATLAA